MFNIAYDVTHYITPYVILLTHKKKQQYLSDVIT